MKVLAHDLSLLLLYSQSRLLVTGIGNICVEGCARNGAGRARASRMKVTVRSVNLIPFSCRFGHTRFDVSAESQYDSEQPRSNCALNLSSPGSRQMAKPENKPPNHRSIQRRFRNAI